jgi:hypothetical protein
MRMNPLILQNLLVDNDHLIECIKLRIYDYIVYVKIVEKDRKLQSKYIKKLVKNIKKYPLTTDGLMSALIYCEKELAKFEYMLKLYHHCYETSKHF